MDDDTYYWFYLSSDHPFQVYYKVREVLQSTTLQLYRLFERTLVHTLCLADVNLQIWSLRHMLWFIDHFKNWVSADQCHKYDCI